MLTPQESRKIDFLKRQIDALIDAALLTAVKAAHTAPIYKAVVAAGVDPAAHENSLTNSIAKLGEWRRAAEQEATRLGQEILEHRRRTGEIVFALSGAAPPDLEVWPSDGPNALEDAVPNPDAWGPLAQAIQVLYEHANGEWARRGARTAAATHLGEVEAGGAEMVEDPASIKMWQPELPWKLHTSSPKILLHYVNHRGERGDRRITPIRFEFTKTVWHPDEQWILIAWDHDKGGTRHFACADIVDWRFPHPPRRTGPGADTEPHADMLDSTRDAEPPSLRWQRTSGAPKDWLIWLTNNHTFRLEMERATSCALVHLRTGDPARSVLTSARLDLSTLAPDLPRGVAALRWADAWLQGHPEVCRCAHNKNQHGCWGECSAPACDCSEFLSAVQPSTATNTKETT